MTNPTTYSPKALALVEHWEGCKLTAYPDPGSEDGRPWTIGWGATGPGIGPGVHWTQTQADARLMLDLDHTAMSVAHLLGAAPRTQDQFDALVAFQFNTGGLGIKGGSRLLRKHLAGDYAGAKAEFGKWIYNDHKPMPGLRNRRAAEAALYAGAV